ncbi:methyltransferase domain-containing protein [bacterium]|nr:methyltransferase domain-containing protein [bacterium]
MSILRYCYGMDSLERHRAMAAVIREALPAPATLLDVGGEANIRCNHLGRFLKGYDISTLNAYRQSDVTYEGGRLPFADNEFDAVVSLDTAEHVPRADRKAWIEDFFRVARKKVIICAPWGSEYQSGVDRELNELFKELFGHEHHYLAEHVACTMPDIPEIREWVGDRDYKLYFDGDARIYRKHLITLFTVQKKGGPLKTPLKLLHQFTTLLDLKSLHLLNEPHPHTRRWYLSVSV